jgi:hypothetical protein
MGSMALRALGRHEDDDVVGSVRTMALRARGRRRVNGVTGSRTTQGAQHRGLGDDIVTSSGRGRWRRVKGAQPWSGMTVWTLWGG